MTKSHNFISNLSGKTRQIKFDKDEDFIITNDFLTTLKCQIKRSEVIKHKI